jgi:membrane-bound lytic murein transglycosylase F
VPLYLFKILAFILTPISVTDKYDDEIKKASERYLPEWDWRWLKAQYYQESLLDPNAQSPVGAKGIAQFMPLTCIEEFNRLGEKCDPYNASLSIRAGASYMKRLRRVFKARRPEYDRRRWAQASYNRGIGNILKDQRRCGNNSSWTLTIPCVPKQETINYVDIIEKVWIRFIFNSK